MLAEQFDLWGYDRVYTPTFELLEVVERGLGASSRGALFPFVDPAAGEVAVLRPDFTAQVARMVAARMNGRPRPLRLSYEGRVSRAQDPLGRGLSQRDVFQAGVELIGANPPVADLEVLGLAKACFDALERSLTLTLGHAAVVDGLLAPTADRMEVRQALARKDAAWLRRVAPELEPLLDLYGDATVLPRARRVLAHAPESVVRALDELERLAGSLDGEAGASLTFDLGEQRGLDYYTGFFFQGYVDGAPGEVLSGGRYDALLAKFGRLEAAAGFAIDVGALAAATEQAPQPRGVVLVAPDDGSMSTHHRLFEEAMRRRRAGERVVIVEASAATAYAEANGFRNVVAASSVTSDSETGSAP